MFFFHPQINGNDSTGKKANSGRKSGSGVKTPYKRVRDDEVPSSNMRSNTYANLRAQNDSTWGDKAHEDFKTVKGRDYRHEKTKKKR